MTISYYYTAEGLCAVEKLIEFNTKDGNEFEFEIPKKDEAKRICEFIHATENRMMDAETVQALIDVGYIKLDEFAEWNPVFEDYLKDYYADKAQSQLEKEI